MNIFITLIWLLVLAVILWAGWRSRDQLLPYLKNADFSQLWGVIGAYLLALVLAIASWAVIIHAFNPTISWWTHVRIYLVTIVAKRLPGTVWYIGGRMMLYKQLGVSQVTTASASGIELIVSFVADCLLAGFLLPFGLGLSLYWLIPLGGASLLGLLILRPATLARIMRWLKRPLVQQIEPWRVGLWLLIRIALILAGGLMIFQIVRVFYPMKINMLLLVLGARAVSGAAGMLTYFLPSSFGASDITLLTLLSTAIPVSLATVVALSVRLITSSFEVFFGVIFYFILRKSPDLNLEGFLTPPTSKF